MRKIISNIIYDDRSIGLHREADMIEQQLKMKQTPGPMPIPSGKLPRTFY